ncbi:MAG TPA: hypothetical protein VM554_15875 [Acidisarcina sp.]|nr:hypothetical protein [Acidisarcina sp.]
MRAIYGVLFAFALSVAAPSQETTQVASRGAVITYAYENANLVPPRYLLSVREDGTGTYESPDGIVTGAAAGHGKPFKQEITISPATLHMMFSVAREHKLFNVGCEATGVGRIAFQGKKVLGYEGTDGKGSCTFNYSKIKQIQQLSDTLQSIASALEIGHHLEVDHQYDRLSLDADLASLAESVSLGRALELQNIRTTLQEIASDPGVLNRARQRATVLLNGGQH